MTKRSVAARAEAVDLAGAVGGQSVDAEGLVMRQRSLRLPAATLGLLDRRARERGQSANALAARIIEEGLRLERHPLVYFREAAAGRRPALVGSRLDVWKVIETVRNHDGSVEDAAAYLDIDPGRVHACVSYYAEFRDEIDVWARRIDGIAEQERRAHEAEREAFR